MNSFEEMQAGGQPLNQGQYANLAAQMRGQVPYGGNRLLPGQQPGGSVNQQWSSADISPDYLDRFKKYKKILEQFSGLKQAGFAGKVPHYSFEEINTPEFENTIKKLQAQIEYQNTLIGIDKLQKQLNPGQGGY